jgi:hypothetical protein
MIILCLSFYICTPLPVVMLYKYIVLSKADSFTVSLGAMAAVEETIVALRGTPSPVPKLPLQP